MNKISTFIAASALAIIPLTGANADSDNPRYDGFAVQDTAPAQRYFITPRADTSHRATTSQRVVPAYGDVQRPQRRVDEDRSIYNYAGDGSISSF